MNEKDIVVSSPRGLYCRTGDFYIDPWKPVDIALITHAHSDHARGGSKQYFAIEDNVALLQKRIGPVLDLTALAPGEKRAFKDVEVSFHPAGHILGSAQIRIDTGRSVWVVSGDYKRAADPTCAAFQPVRCDTFISEATFALPIYRWPAAAAVAREIHDWWRSNRQQGIASVLFCYALGKAQRVLAELTSFTDEPVYAHGAVEALAEIYRARNIRMLPTLGIDQGRRGDFSQSLIIAPPGAAGSVWMRRFQPCATGFCSGWMRVRGQRRRRGYDRGFVLSDHADWPALLDTVRDVGSSRVLLTHGYSDTLVRFLKEQGCDAAALQTAYGAEE